LTGGKNFSSFAYMRSNFLMLSAMFFVVLAARAQLVTPVSYTATPGETGLFTYFDDTGAQLTDGVLGANDWTLNLGQGNAQEWVGWVIVEPVLTFTFTGSPTLHEVQIGFNRDENGGGIFLPTRVCHQLTRGWEAGSRGCDDQTLRLA
jgi:hypothetical protein